MEQRYFFLQKYLCSMNTPAFNIKQIFILGKIVFCMDGPGIS